MFWNKKELKTFRLCTKLHPSFHAILSRWLNIVSGLLFCDMHFGPSHWIRAKKWYCRRKKAILLAGKYWLCQTRSLNNLFHYLMEQNSCMEPLPCLQLLFEHPTLVLGESLRVGCVAPSSISGFISTLTTTTSQFTPKNKFHFFHNFHYLLLFLFYYGTSFRVADFATFLRIQVPHERTRLALNGEN